MSRQVKPRIIITMQGGLITAISCDGIDAPEMIQVAVIDYDVEPDDHDDVLLNLAGEIAFVGLRDVEALADPVARDLFAYLDGLAM